MEKMISFLLKDALTDMENLQDYYLSQKSYVHTYVKDNIGKYKYGVILDRFFTKKVIELEELEISEYEQKVVDEIVDEFTIEENEDGSVVKYKLNSTKDFSNYEMDPQNARINFSKLIQQPSILNESMIMMLLVKYEEAISGIYRFLLESYPQAYLSDKSITYSELISFDSNIDDIKEKFISKEIDEFMRLPISDWYKSFETKQKATFFFNNDEFEIFKEIYYRRNLVVHNQGIVNEVYKKNVMKCEYEIGERLTVNDDYLKNAFIAARKIVIGTVWGLRKTADDSEELNDFLFEYGYNCLKNEEWELAEYIYSMLLNDDNQNGADKMYEQVNMWIAIKNGKGLEIIEEDVKNLDISAMKNQFAVAKYALLNEFETVSMLLEDAIKSEIPAWCIKEWPLLNQYRESEQYKTFIEEHKEMFETQGYESNNETVESAEEILHELRNDLEGELGQAM